jgi:hypothetical protein
MHLQEAARASRGLVHRWALGAAASTVVVGREVSVGRATMRVELGSLFLSRLTKSHALDNPSATKGSMLQLNHYFRT